ncbi:MAG: hypothetical protein Q4D58_00105 [Synergistaceae bacterium]|nr:hypothetical protein [Synergistaceae bacterium]
MTEMTNKPLSIAEAKKNLELALEAVEPANIVRAYPLKSVGAAAAAGALLSFLSGRSLFRFAFPAAELLELAARLFAGGESE